MLVLTRAVNQRIYVGEGPGRVVITLLKTSYGEARIGIDAAPDVLVMREELVEEKDRVEGWDRRIKR